MKIFLDSSMVEHSAVNRVVAGSSPARGVKPAAGAAAKCQRDDTKKPVNLSVCGLFAVARDLLIKKMIAKSLFMDYTYKVFTNEVPSAVNQTGWR